MTSYCTHGDISAFLQVAAFTDSPATTPTQAQVEAFIEMAEGRIDKLTDHAWATARAKSVTDERVRIQTVRSNYITARGRLQLRHYPILSFSQHASPSLSQTNGTVKIWDGGKYLDYLDSDESKTMGSNVTDVVSKDFWIDTERGNVYLNSWTAFFSAAPTGVDAYVSYKYATATTPDDIKLAAIYLTSAIIASNDDLNLMPAVDDSMDNRTKAELWEAQGLKMLEPYIGRNMPLARAIAGFGTVR
jgi:hypothetical protein